VQLVAQLIGAAPSAAAAAALAAPLQQALAAALAQPALGFGFGVAASDIVYALQQTQMLALLQLSGFSAAAFAQISSLLSAAIAADVGAPDPQMVSVQLGGAWAGAGGGSSESSSAGRKLRAAVPGAPLVTLLTIGGVNDAQAAAYAVALRALLASRPSASRTFGPGGPLAGPGLASVWANATSLQLGLAVSLRAGGAAAAGQLAAALVASVAAVDEALSGALAGQGLGRVRLLGTPMLLLPGSMVPSPPAPLSSDSLSRQRIYIYLGVALVGLVVLISLCAFAWLLTARSMDGGGGGGGQAGMRLSRVQRLQRRLEASAATAVAILERKPQLVPSLVFSFGSEDAPCVAFETLAFLASQEEGGQEQRHRLRYLNPLARRSAGGAAPAVQPAAAVAAAARPPARRVAPRRREREGDWGRELRDWELGFSGSGPSAEEVAAADIDLEMVALGREEDFRATGDAELRTVT